MQCDVAGHSLQHRRWCFFGAPWGQRPATASAPFGLWPLLSLKFPRGSSCCSQMANFGQTIFSDILGAFRIYRDWTNPKSTAYAAYAAYAAFNIFWGKGQKGQVPSRSMVWCHVHPRPGVAALSEKVALSEFDKLKDDVRFLRFYKLRGSRGSGGSRAPGGRLCGLVTRHQAPQTTAKAWSHQHMKQQPLFGISCCIEQIERFFKSFVNTIVFRGDDNIFSKIIDGTIPCFKIFETEDGCSIKCIGSKYALCKHVCASRVLALRTLLLSWMHSQKRRAILFWFRNGRPEQSEWTRKFSSEHLWYKVFDWFWLVESGISGLHFAGEHAWSLRWS